MKKLIIPLYAGLAVTVWLVFLPSAKDSHETAIVTPSHVELPTAVRRNGPSSAMQPREARAISAPVPTTMEGAPNPIPEEPFADSSMPATGGPPITESAGVASIVEEDRYYGVATITNHARQTRTQIFPSGTEEDNETSRPGRSSPSAAHDNQAHVAGFSFLPTATEARLETSPLDTQTAVTETSAGDTQAIDDNRQETNQKMSSEITTTTDSGATGDTETIPATDNTTAANEGNAFLPQGDISQTPTGLEPASPSFECPTSCYLECTPYEINMLIKQGCPVPSD